MPTTRPVLATHLELETGFGKDLLRKWRQRYGFPQPIATGSGKVAYSRQTVDQLLVIKHLLDCGFRPAKIVGKTPLELARLNQTTAGQCPATAPNESIRRLIERVRQSDLTGLQTLLATARARGTLTDFVVNTVAPLLTELGAAWSRQEIEIFHEHFCTVIIQRCLHAEVQACKKKPGHPRILFATPPEENHVMGRLMAEAVLADQGAHIACTGTHLPINDMALAAAAFRADVLALSFSIAYPRRRIRPTLLQVRRLLPARIQLWVGGAGAGAGAGAAIIMRPPKGMRIFSDFQESVTALHDLARQKRG